jgi:hypothetical protein
VRVRSGSSEKIGVLRYNKAGKSYQGNVEISGASDDSLEIVVMLIDLAGNVNEVRLQ